MTGVTVVSISAKIFGNSRSTQVLSSTRRAWRFRVSSKYRAASTPLLSPALPHLARNGASTRSRVEAHCRSRLMHEARRSRSNVIDALRLRSASRGFDGHHAAAERPEERIFRAAEVPHPLAFGEAPARPCGDEQEYRREQRGEHREDVEHESDRHDDLDRECRIEPCDRRIQADLSHEAFDEVLVLELHEQVRDEKEPTDDPEDIEAVGQIEAFGHMTQHSSSGQARPGGRATVNRGTVTLQLRRNERA